MALTVATGSVAAIADMATSIIGMIQTYEAAHNSPGMLQAAISAQWQAAKDTAAQAVATEETVLIEKGISQ